MKKFLIVLMTLMLIGTCGIFVKRTIDKPHYQPIVAPNDDMLYYLDELKNYVPKDKSVYAETDNQAFEDYLDKVFKYYIAQDYLAMHYKVKDYRALGLEKPKLSIAELEYKFDEDAYYQELGYLFELEDFDFTSLSKKQQIDYECLQYSMYEDLVAAHFWMYQKVFTDANCYPEDVYSNMNDFVFYDEETVEDYLALLETYDQLFDDCIAYTNAQYKDGIYTLDSSLDYTKDAIKGVLATKDDPELITGFNAKIDELPGISDANKAKYKAENRRIVMDVVYPAYENLLPKLDKYYGKVKNVYDQALCNIDPFYADFNLIISTSNTRSASEMINLLVNAINYYEIIVYDYLSDDIKAAMMDSAEFDPAYPFALDATDVLEYLRLNAYKYYPELGETSYDAQFLNPDTAPDSVLAYYYPAPIDDTNQNVIRINPNGVTGGYEAYITLAHEGFPGHLFQHVYQARKNQNNIHDVISFVGFVEGFAVYASRDAMLYSGLKDLDMADAAFYLNEYYFMVYSLVDLLVNQYAYSPADVKEFFEENIALNYFGEDFTPACEFLIERTGTYERYGVGFAELLAYRFEAEDYLGELFDAADFNEMLIRDGDMPFVLMDAKFEDYINQHIDFAE